MTDRELLELAAKAAGISLRGWSDYFQGYNSDHDAYHDAAWNPLTDDGDAFRLAISCGLSIEPYPYYNTPKHSVIVKQRRRGDQMRETNPTEAVEVYGDDANAATRRAIVRAAAEIGKAMP